MRFEYSLGLAELIPVLVGKGLVGGYPLGAQFRMYDPALMREAGVTVAGVIAENSARSNFYALDSKQYCNCSVVVPIIRTFIKQADAGFNVNALMDLVLADTDRADVPAYSLFLSSCCQSGAR